LGNR
ncbi:hypothetical protein D030_4826B, partial [Vibrio parahaemolyticus AQ3810]|jgi:hypothetical protein